MSSTSQVTTFSDLYTDLSNRVRVATGVTATENQAKRYINTALWDMHVGWGEHFWWAHRSDVLRTHEPYTTGTVTVTVGSTTLTGASTLWNTNNDFAEANMRAGGKFTVSGSDVYEISSVSSDTAAVLTQRYIAATGTAATYTYYEDEYALSGDFLRPLDLQLFSADLDIQLIDPIEFRRRYPRNSTRGEPKVATLIAKDPSSSTAVRTRVRFHPAPADIYMVPYSFVTNKLAVGSSGTLATALSSDADEPIVPLEYRHAIVLHALANWYRDKRDDDRHKDVWAQWSNLMTRITGDTRIGVQPRPRFAPRSGLQMARARYPWSGSGGGRYTTGTSFDQMRS